MEDKGGDHSQGDSVDAFGPEVHLVDDASGGIAPVGEYGEAGNVGQVRPQVAVGQGEESQDGQGNSDAPAGSFQDEKDGKVSQDEVLVLG